MLRKSTTVLVAIAATLVPAASFAESAHHRDARHDVTGAAGHAKPGNAVTDLTRVAVHHRSHRVVVRAHVREVRFRGPVLLLVRVTTPEQTFVAQSVRWADEAPLAFLIDGDDADVDCVGLRGDLSAPRDLLRMSIPRRCLDHPRWVRVGVGLVVIRDADHGNVDDGLTRHAAHINDLTLTRRLAIG